MLQSMQDIIPKFRNKTKIEYMKTHYQIVIVGSGTGGIMTASQLRRKNKNLDIVIIDPSETHYYQPAWTLVGAELMILIKQLVLPKA